jgi:hypothetical protein
MRHGTAWTAVTVLTFVLAAAPASAQPFGASRAEFRVNTVTTFNQTVPAIGVDESGFVIAWREESVLPVRIMAQRFSAGGAPLGNSFRVNTVTTFSKDRPTVAMGVGGSAGAFVVVWASTGEDLDSAGVFAQRFGANGAALGGQFRANTYTSGFQSYPAVATDSSGDFLVVWVSGAQEGRSIRGQLFSSAGAPVGGEFRVNTMTATSNDDPRVSGGAAGFVVVWSASQEVVMQPSVVARRYSSAGGPFGPEFQVDTSTGYYHTQPDVSVSPAGFVVAWTQYPAGDGANRDIFARRFASTGAPETVPFRVNTYTTSFQGRPRVAADGTGAFVVTWQDFQEGTHDVFAQRFGAAGSPLGDEFRVNSYTTDFQGNYAVGAWSKGFVVTWPSPDGSFTGTFARQFCNSLAGDANGDSTITVADVFYMINFLFAGGPLPARGIDANGDGVVDVNDVFYLINFLFAGGPAPACS